MNSSLELMSYQSNDSLNKNLKIRIKSFCLRNICVCTVYIYYVYINTHMHVYI